MFYPTSGIAGYDQYNVCYSYKEYKLNNYKISFEERNVYKFKLQDDLYSLWYDKKLQKLYVRDNDIDKQVEIKIDYVKDYEVFENYNNIIIAINSKKTNSTIYYLEIEKNDSFNVEGINELLLKYELPAIDKIGYLTKNNYNYLYMEDRLSNKFIIKDRVYLIKN